LAFAQAEPVLVDDVEPDVVSSMLGSAPLSPDNGFLTTETSLAILEAYGINTMKVHLARDPEEAVAYTGKVGFPVAVKVASPDIPHKSDVGGVILNLEDEDSVRAGFESVIQRSLDAHPTAHIEGVYIQRMVPSGQEVIIGAVRVLSLVRW
jgi:acetyltransferase